MDRKGSVERGAHHHHHHHHRRRRRSSSASASLSPISSPSSSSFSSSLSSPSSSDEERSRRRRRGHRRRDEEKDGRHHHHHHRHSSRRRGGGGRRGLLQISDSSSASSLDRERGDGGAAPVQEGLLGMPNTDIFQATGILSMDTGYLPDDGEDVDDTLLPSAAWVCVVCSNLNSIHRVECFRCGISYARNCRACPSSEIVVHHVLPREAGEDLSAVAVGSGGTTTPLQASPAREPKEAKDVVLAGLSSALAEQGEVLETVATATRGRAVYVRFPSVEAAGRALLLCHCALPLGEHGAKCVMEYSSRNVTPPVVGSAGLLGEATASLSATGTAAKDGADTLAAEKVDPSLAGVPQELWPHNWQPPEGFASADEERRYLALLSEHWHALSAKQKAYYDAGVKRALARAEAEGAEERGDGQPQQAQSAVRQVESSTPAAPSSLSAIKKRLAERKAALMTKESGGSGGDTGTGGLTPSAATPPSPTSSTASSSEPTRSSTAVSSLKQRLAEKKARLASASTAPASTSEAAEATAQGGGSSHPVTGSGDARPASLFGIPLPPGATDGGGSDNPAVPIVKGMPWEVAQRVAAPTLLLSALYNKADHV